MLPVKVRKATKLWSKKNYIKNEFKIRVYEK
jgi:hypothetical protein